MGAPDLRSTRLTRCSVLASLTRMLTTSLLANWRTISAYTQVIAANLPLARSDCAFAARDWGVAPVGAGGPFGAGTLSARHPRDAARFPRRRGRSAARAPDLSRRLFRRCAHGDRSNPSAGTRCA